MLACAEPLLIKTDVTGLLVASKGSIVSPRIGRDPLSEVIDVNHQRRKQ